jgi:hypothetical protein
MSTGVAQVAAHIATSILIVSAAVFVSALVAFGVARKYGGRSRRRQQMIFRLVGAVGLLGAGGIMFLRLQSKAWGHGTRTCGFWNVRALQAPSVCNRAFNH